MASFEKRGNKIRAMICAKGVRRSKSFPSMGAARVWANEQELEIHSGDRGEIPDKTFADLLDRYAETVTPQNRGGRWEQVRITALKRDRIAQVRLRDLNTTHIAQWREDRLKTVSGSTVNREKNLLSSACRVARIEWGWLKKNPFTGVDMPKENPHRTRIMLDHEWDALIKAAITPIYAKVIRAMEFAVETGMRAGEIVSLEKSDIKGAVAVLAMTKNGESREVPLSAKALKIISESTDSPLFGFNSKTLDIHWRNLKKIAGVDGLTFHDLRHTAATRLSKKLNLLQLCKMFGWRDPKHALIYYNETAEDIAKKLNQGARRG